MNDSLRESPPVRFGQESGCAEAAMQSCWRSNPSATGHPELSEIDYQNGCNGTLGTLQPGRRCRSSLWKAFFGRGFRCLLTLCLLWLVPLCVRAASLPDQGLRSSHVVAVFAGHTASLDWNGNHQGVKSASGVWEYRYNDRVAALFPERSTRNIRYMVFPAGLNLPYQSRAELAAIVGAEILLEIHHDGVQPNLYDSLLTARETDPKLSYYRGFSLHVFPGSPSVPLAREIESAMEAAGFFPSTYHQEDIPGESMSLLPGTRAIYARNGLAVLKSATIPAVIVECGCINNPLEDKLLNDRDYQMRIVDAVGRGVERYFAKKQP